MAAGATGEDVKKISQIMAQTVRQLEVGSPEPGLEALKPACDVVVLDAELPFVHTWIPQYGHRKPRSHQEEFVERSHRKETLGEEVQAGGRCLITCSVTGFGFGSSQYLLISRFPELAKRRIQVLFAPQGSCLAPSTTQLANGLRICPARAKWNWNHCSHKLVNADKCLVNVSRNNPSPTRHRSVRTSTALTVIWIDFPCLFLPERVGDPAHTQQFCDYLSLFQEGERSGGGSTSFDEFAFSCHGRQGTEVIPFAITRPEGGANTPGRNASWRFSKGVVNILHCNVTAWSEHARHYILTSDFDATLISETHLGRDRLLSAVEEARKSGWAGTGSAATNTVNNGTSAGVLALVWKRLVLQAPVNLQCRCWYSVQTHDRQGGSIRVMGRENLLLTAYFEHPVGFRSDINANLMHDVCFLTRDGKFSFIFGADFNFPPSLWQDLSPHGGGIWIKQLGASVVTPEGSSHGRADAKNPASSITSWCLHAFGLWYKNAK